ncbi:MAG: serine protease [Solirubrobacteraceae bacterium]|jgi:hypothetical protein|nr:serine protease [Solirubrobacteraceae bacterium]
MHTSHDQQHHQHHDALDHERGACDDGLSGFVILRLARELEPGDSRDLLEHSQELQLHSLAELLDALGQPPTRRVITSLEPGELLELEEQAMNTPLRPLNSLTRYWRIDTRGLAQPIDELVQRFSQLDGVELAYAEMVVSDPAARAITVTRNPLSAWQDYLKKAPIGINARWAWTKPGGKGNRVRVADIEQGWRLRHEDLRGKAPTLIPNPNGHVPLINRDGTGGYIGHHGAAVMGVIAADDNDRGIIGIAPMLDSLLAAPIYDAMDAVHVADALTNASKATSSGDVLLLEVQRGLDEDALPTETDSADFDAIRLATSHGRIVIEAAGNGNSNLDEWRDVTTKRRRLSRDDLDFEDSGAIMVGACQSALAAVVIDDDHSTLGHARALTSNYGSRIDCYAWGENVTTSGYDGPSPDTAYTLGFGGTSSAAAIIAGAAVLTQSMHRAKTPTPKELWAIAMRSILSNGATGTLQSTLPTGTIGSMPDLQQIATQVLGIP